MIKTTLTLLYLISQVSPFSNTPNDDVIMKMWGKLYGNNLSENLWQGQKYFIKIVQKILKMFAFILDTDGFLQTLRQKTRFAITISLPLSSIIKKASLLRLVCKTYIKKLIENYNTSITIVKRNRQRVNISLDTFSLLVNR